MLSAVEVQKGNGDDDEEAEARVMESGDEGYRAVDGGRGERERERDRDIEKEEQRERASEETNGYIV